MPGSTARQGIDRRGGLGAAGRVRPERAADPPGDGARRPRTQLRNPLLLLLLAAAAVSGADRRSDRRRRSSRRSSRSASGSASSTSTAPRRRSPRCTRSIRHETVVVARRRCDARRRRRPRAGRRRRAAGRRRRARRPAAARGDRARVRRGGADRRVAAGREVRRLEPAGDSAARPSRLRVHGDDRAPGIGDRGVVVATGTPPRSARSRSGSASDRPRPRSRSGCASFSRLLVRVAGVLTVSIFVINVALLAAVDRRAAVLARDRDRHHAAAAAGDRHGEPVDRLARARAQARARQAARHASRTSATSRCCSPTRPARSPRARSPSTSRSTRRAPRRPTPLLLGLVCNEATMTDTGPVGGNALDVALCGPGRGPAAHAEPTAWPRTSASALLPFDHERQLASVVPARPTARPRWSPRARPRGCWRAASTCRPRARRVLDGLFGDGARVVAVATRDAPGLVRAGRRRRARPAPGRVPRVRRPAEGRRRRGDRALNHLGIVVKIITGDNGTVAAKVCRDLGLGGRGRAHRRGDRGARRRRARGGDPGHDGLRPGQPRAEVAASSRSRAAPASTSRSSATASTTRSRCTRPTSGSPSTPRPTSPRTRPTSSCSTRTSACSPTASWRGGGSSPTRSSTC